MSNLNNLNSETDVILFPNPNNGQFTLSSSNSLGKIDIYDCIGRKIFQTNTLNDKFELNFSNQAKGVYILKQIKENSTTSIMFQLD